MIGEDEGIRIIGSARHALLNDIQLMKGYLYMNQLQRANAVMDRLTDQLRQQSSLCHLPMPKTAFFLVISGWNALPFALSVRIGEGSSKLKTHVISALLDADARLAAFFHQLFSFCGYYMSPSAGNNRIEILFTPMVSSFRLNIDFCGSFNKEGEALTALHQMILHDSLNWEEHNTNEIQQQRMRWNLCLSIK